MKKLSVSLLAVLAVSCSGNLDSLMVSPARKASGVNPDTHLQIVFAPGSGVKAGNSGKIRVFDARTGEVVDSLDMAVPAGPVRGRQYPPECDYTKVPYDYTRTVMATNKNTVPGTPSGTGEPNPPEYQLNIIGGFTDAFHFYPIMVSDDVATIYLHNNMLEYGREYYVTMDPEVLVTDNGSFKGVTKADRWKFRTKAQGPAADADTLRVEADGSGDFCTVQGAMDHIKDWSSRKTVVLVGPGDYLELVYFRNKSNVKIKGAGKDLTKIHYPNNEVFNPHPLLVKTNEWPGTFPSRRAPFAVDNCTDILLEDLTVATDCRGQAEGILINGERVAMNRVRIIGDGDALQANGTIYMTDSELIGGGDTILGRGTLFAVNSLFVNHGGPFSYVRNTAGHHGDILVDCTVMSDNPNIPANFGRTGTRTSLPYPAAEFVLIDCKLKNVAPEGWGYLAQKTQVMLEYNSTDLDTGKPVDVSKRHKWSRQLRADRDGALIANYRNPAWVLGGWTPELW